MGAGCLQAGAPLKAGLVQPLGKRSHEGPGPSSLLPAHTHGASCPTAARPVRFRGVTHHPASERVRALPLNLTLLFSLKPRGGAVVPVTAGAAVFVVRKTWTDSGFAEKALLRAHPPPGPARATLWCNHPAQRLLPHSGLEHRPPGTREAF